MKKLMIILISMIMFTVFTACGSDTEGNAAEGDATNQEEDVEKGAEADNTGVAEEGIVAKLTEVTPDNTGEVAFLYEVINNSGDELEIPFSETDGGGFSYVVRNEAGEEVSDKHPGEGINSNPNISPQESLHTKIILYGYEAGTYELEVWLESELDNTYNQTIMFTVE